MAEEKKEAKDLPKKKIEREGPRHKHRNDRRWDQKPLINKDGVPVPGSDKKLRIRAVKIRRRTIKK